MVRLPALVVAVLFVAVAALPSFAQEYMPWPDAKITAAQWQAYFDQVRSAHGGTEEHLAEHQLVLYTNRAENTQYAFTIPAHPAHPAWVTRRLAEQHGQFVVEQVGYFAGAEPPFAELFEAYQRTTKLMNEQIRRENAGGH